MKPALSVRLGVPVTSATLTLMLALLLAAVLGDEARAQTPEQAPPQPPPVAEKLPVGDFSRPMGPPDPFNRGTPRGSMYGFLATARKGDYGRAAEYLDLRRLPPEDQAEIPQSRQALRERVGSRRQTVLGREGSRAREVSEGARNKKSPEDYLETR